MPFDDSVFQKPLGAEEKGKKKPCGFKAWVVAKANEIKCIFSSGSK